MRAKAAPRELLRGGAPCSAHLQRADRPGQSAPRPAAGHGPAIADSAGEYCSCGVGASWQPVFAANSPSSRRVSHPFGCSPPPSLPHPCMQQRSTS
jgi:hypothetical protein